MVNLAAAGIGFAKEGESTSRILYINSYNPGYSWGDDIEQGLRERFKLSDRKIELSVEYLDSKRFDDHTLQDLQAGIMQAKYNKYPHDLVIVSDNAAFTFAIRNRRRLFPDIPIVFCGYNNFRPNALIGLTNITGVNDVMDINALIEIALLVQPKIKTLAFILSIGDASGKLIGEQIEVLIIPKYEDRYEIVILKDASMSQIKDTLGNLPPESALFMMRL